MGFFTPWFLAGAVAVGLPIWLHLLKKHKTTPLPFSSLMFFERRIQSSIKHRRLRYLVLLALRMALILLIVLAFAHPYVRQAAAPASRTGEVTVLAIDNSLSMRAGNRLDQAKQMARRMVAGLRPGQRAQVLAFGARVQVMSEVTDDRRAAQRRHRCHRKLRRAHVVRGTGALAALHRAIHPPAAGRAPLFGYAAIRHAGQFQRSSAECGRAAGAAPAGDQGSPQLRGGERGGAAARVRQPQVARAGHHRGFRRRPRPRAAFRSS